MTLVDRMKDKAATAKRTSKRGKKTKSREQKSICLEKKTKRRLDYAELLFTRNATR